MKMYGVEGKRIYIRMVGSEELGPFEFNEAEMYDGPHGEMRLLVVKTTCHGTLYFVLRNVACWRVV